MIYLGVDPGKSGAIAAVRNSYTEVRKLSETEADISSWVEYIANLGGVLGGVDKFAILEQVHSMPKQGVASSFKFGASYGFCRGLLIAHKIPFETVTPSKWQAVMKCRTKGDKNVTKARAQELFPDLKITHATADALLLAEYCRRLKNA
jgi:crossover junction endodeoxyribonuclease RuvC